MSEDKKQSRKLGLAILVSLFLHLAVGFSLAAFGNVSPSTIPAEEAPSELTIMDLSPAPAPEKNPQFVETEKSKESAEKPKEQTFESNANSLAASEKAPAGDVPLPSQDGKDLPARDLQTHDFSLQTQGSQPQPQQPDQPASKPANSPPPKASPADTPKLTPSPAPTATVEPEQLAMLDPTTARQRAGRYRAVSLAKARAIYRAGGRAAPETTNSQLQLSTAKAADAHRGQHFQSRAVFGKCGRDAARSLPKEDV